MIGPSRSDEREGKKEAGIQNAGRFPLLRYYLVTSVIVIVVITLGVAFLFVKKAENDFAESSSTQGSITAGHVAHLFFNEVWAEARPQRVDLTLQDVINPISLEDFTRRSTFGLNIIKLNVIDLDGRVVWSSDPSTQIEDRANNKLYTTVFRRDVPSSELRRGQMFPDLAGQHQLHDVVHTVHPLRNATPFSHWKGNIVGLVEIDKDVTNELAAVRNGTLLFAVLGSVAMGTILFALLFLIILRADRAIARGHERIQRLSEYSNRIISNTPIALAVIKGSTRIVTSVNKAFVESIGLKGHDIVGRSITQTLPLERLEGIIEECLLHPENIEMNETHYTDSDGLDRWFMISAAPLREETDVQAESEALLVLSEITEQKQQQERLLETARLASIGELAAGVAHEINNPLTVVTGFSEVLLDSDLPTTAKEHVRMVHSEAQRAARIVQNLLSFARSHEPEKRHMNVNTVLERALDLKESDFKISNINVTKFWAKNLNFTMVDEHQLIQAILNILSNAEKAMFVAQGKGELMITTSQTGSKIRISVADNGPGIPHAHLNKVFDPFFTTNEVGEGTGLGLSICYAIVRQHEGELWAESQLGIGSTFHIELPIISPDVEPRFEGSEVVLAPSRQRRILVVDDEPNIRILLSEVLTKDGHTVEVASNGQQAAEMIQECQYDCLIMDITMPGVGGTNLYKHINESKPDLIPKIIFITGDTVRSDTRAFLKAAGNPTLNKPLDLTELKNCIQSLTEV